VAGANQVTVAVAFLRWPARPWAPSGTVVGMTAWGEAEEGPAPARLVAVTCTVYSVPLARPVISRSSLRRAPQR